MTVDSVRSDPIGRRQHAALCDTIARRFLPSRWHYHYVRSKLATDPLYPGVAAALGERGLPLLDLGCGIGLLAHYLDGRGARGGYLGLDNDPRKIARARTVASRAGLSNLQFELVDLSRPAGEHDAAAQQALAHRGDVAILDLLQFLPPEAQAPLLATAASCVAPGGRLVIRTGLAGRGWRARVTRAVDVLSRLLRWMNTGPKAYPQREALASLLAKAGLQVQFSPLWGSTPFNNWLVVAERAGNAGSTQR